jgi:hypothetical protein
MEEQGMMKNNHYKNAINKIEMNQTKPHQKRKHVDRKNNRGRKTTNENQQKKKIKGPQTENQP